MSIGVLKRSRDRLQDMFAVVRGDNSNDLKYTCASV